MTNYSRPKKPAMLTQNPLHTIFFSVLVIALPALILLHTPLTPTSPCTTTTTSSSSSSGHTAIHKWSGDLRNGQFSWNHLPFTDRHPPPETLKIAVFSRKWPVTSSPGGMERHALTLYTALARRGHCVHVFTSPPLPLLSDGTTISKEPITSRTGISSPQLHFLEGPPGQWRCNDAWSLFEDENLREAPFDVVHSESVALHHRLAHGVPNLAVSWHGIALEALQSVIFQDLTRGPGEAMSTSLNRSLYGAPLKILDEIRFFKSYAHHVAISDSSGEMLRDLYQIPNGRVHVIINGVDDQEFGPDVGLGRAFREEIGLPANASLVMGVAGRLVRDKGHPLLHEAFSKLMIEYPDVYLIVAGSGPWAQRYSDLGPRVLTLGAMPPSQLKAFYNSIDVFVNPTLRPQGLDLTLMEAMQCGKPILATRFPSIKGTLVVDDEFGYMFSPNADSLLEVMETVVREGSRRLAERGRACREYAVTMFTATKMAMAYERLFLCIKNETYCKYPLHFD